MSAPLPLDFYFSPTEIVARNLIGKGLWVRHGRSTLVCEIVETEAYLGKNDPASHSHRGRTVRNAPMFGPGGTCYVYLSYGIHFCMNVVTGEEGVGEAVLLRAAIPRQGRKEMAERRGGVSERLWMNGPGKLAQAMGIDLTHNQRRFDRPDFKLVDLESRIGEGEIGVSGRIGISRGTELPLRFFLKNSPWVSRVPRPKGSKKTRVL